VSRLHVYAKLYIICMVIPIYIIYIVVCLVISRLDVYGKAYLAMHLHV